MGYRSEAGSELLIRFAEWEHHERSITPASSTACPTKLWLPREPALPVSEVASTMFLTSSTLLLPVVHPDFFWNRSSGE